MRALLLLACLVALANAEWGWELTFADEFNGNALNLSNWKPEHSTYGDGNMEIACLTPRPQNIRVEGGNLIITSIRESTPYVCPNEKRQAEFPNGRPWTSAMIKSKGKFQQAFGKFEVRAKMQTVKAVWPAFWTLSVNYPYGGNGQSGEWDIFEHFGNKYGDQISGTVHTSYSPSKKNGRAYKLTGGETFASWHTFTGEWDHQDPGNPNSPTVLRWYVDGNLYLTSVCQHQDSMVWPNWAPWGTEAQTAGCSAPWTANNPEYLVLNQAVGSTGLGHPDETVPDQVEFIVDYVRVWKRKWIETTDTAATTSAASTTSRAASTTRSASTTRASTTAAATTATTGSSGPFTFLGNFQPSATPIGYIVPITGAAFGSSSYGFNFGWNVTNPYLYTRNSGVSNLALDSFAHLVAKGNGYKWELAVPAAGDYVVWVVLGEPLYYGTHSANVEGDVFSRTSSAEYPWTLYINARTVTDGRLTIGPGEWSNANWPAHKINAVLVQATTGTVTRVVAAHAGKRADDEDGRTGTTDLPPVNHLPTPDAGAVFGGVAFPDTFDYFRPEPHPVAVDYARLTGEPVERFHVRPAHARAGRQAEAAGFDVVVMDLPGDVAGKASAIADSVASATPADWAAVGSTIESVSVIADPLAAAGAAGAAGLSTGAIVGIAVASAAGVAALTAAAVVVAMRVAKSSQPESGATQLEGNRAEWSEQALEEVSPRTESGAVGASAAAAEPPSKKGFRKTFYRWFPERKSVH